MLATTVGVADTLSRLRRLVRLGGHNVDRLGWEQHYRSQSLPLTPSPSLGHPEINRRRWLADKLTRVKKFCPSLAVLSAQSSPSLADPDQTDKKKSTKTCSVTPL